MNIDCLRQLLTLAESIAKTGAFFGAALFFGWKWLAGWLIVNLQVSLDATRQTKTDGTDFLTLRLKLDKGATDTLWLRNIAVRIIADDYTQDVPIDIFDLKRLRVEGETNHRYITWIRAADNETLSLSPSESLHFGRTVDVPSGVPLLIIAAVYGDRPLWRRRGFQWRSSIGCAPVVQTPIIPVPQGISSSS